MIVRYASYDPGTGHIVQYGHSIPPDEWPYIEHDIEGVLIGLKVDLETLQLVPVDPP